MLLAVFVFSLVCAGVCLGLLLFDWPRARGPKSGVRLGTHRAPAGVLALLFVVLAAAIAILDDKVASADTTTRTEAGPNRALEYPVTQSDLAGFRGNATTSHRRLRKTLCLVQYFDEAKELGMERSYKWWTSCNQNDAFKTVADVQQKLALPPDWGPRNTRAVACVPVNAAMPYMRGLAAPQRSASRGKRYRGGAIEYRVLRFETDWIHELEPVTPAPAPLPPVDAPCKT